MNHIVGPYLCFTHNRPTRWLCILMDDDKVVSVQSAAYFPQAIQLNWQSVEPSGLNYIFDATSEGPSQSFLLLIEDKHLFRVLKPQHNQVNSVERLQYNGTHPFWHIDSSHKAHNASHPIPSHVTLCKLIQVQLGQFPVMETSHFESKLKSLCSSVQTPIHFQKTSVDLPGAAVASSVFSLEQAFSLLTNPKCVVVGTPSLKLRPMTVYLCKHSGSWKGAIKIAKKRIDITFSLDEFPELHEFLDQYNKIRTYLEITDALKKQNLLHLVVSGYLRLSLYQQKIVVNLMELADIWPIQDTLTIKDQQGILKVLFGFPAEKLRKKLSEAALLHLSSMREYLKPDNLIRLEKTELFYLSSDKHRVVAKNANLEDVYNFTYHLLRSAAAYVNLQSFPLLEPPKDTQKLNIGGAVKTSAETAVQVLSEPEDEFYQFFTETDRAWEEYSLSQLRNFRGVALGLIERNPQFSSLSQLLLAIEHEDPAELEIMASDRLFVNLQTISKIITLVLRLNECIASATSQLNLMPVFEMIQSLDDFIIVFKCSAVSFYSYIYSLLKEKIDTYYQDIDDQVLLKLLGALGTAQQFALISEMQSDVFNYIHNLDGFYAIIIGLPEANLISFLDEFHSDLASLSVTWTNYLRVYGSIPYAAKLKFMRYTEGQTLRALANSSTEQVRLFISQLNGMGELTRWLTHVSIAIKHQLLRHYDISKLLSVFENDTRNLLTYFVELLEPHQVKLFLNNFSLHQLTLDISAPDGAALVSDLCRLAEGYIYSKVAFNNLLEEIPSQHLPIFLINGPLMSRYDHTPDELIYFMKKLDETSRLPFLRALGVERMHRMIPRQCQFIEIAQCIPSSDFKEFLNLCGVRIQEFIPELCMLAFVHEQLNPQSRSILLASLVYNQFLYVSSPHINWHQVDMNSQIEILKTWLDLNEFRRALSISAHARESLFSMRSQHLYEKSLITHLQQLILFNTDVDQDERVRNYSNDLSALRDRAVTVYQDVSYQLEGRAVSPTLFVTHCTSQPQA